MACRDCKLYDLDATKNARGAVLSNRIARCLWVSKEVYPASVPSWNPVAPKAGSMRPNDGHHCPRFIKRDIP